MPSDYQKTQNNRQQAGVIDTRHSPHGRLRTVPIGAVEMGDGFWGPWMDKNVRKAIPEFFKLMEEHGTIDNFRWQAESEDVDFDYPVKSSFGSESDVYKWLEGACLALQSHQSAQLRQTLEDLTDLIAASQGDDGYLYLNTLRGTYERPEQRFTNLQFSHELYCVGHLMQAAIACYRATGQQKLLAVARRCADYICTEFGPGKREETDGHPEIEMALVELYRTTGQQRYLDMAGFFIRQPQPLQDLPPIAQRPELVGHAVRSGYICCGAADYCAETGDQQLWQHLVDLWEDLVTSKIYITGGVGAHHTKEEFGESFELPNLRAYAETCAAIAHFMWAWRMLIVTGEAQYADVMERIIYNGVLSGLSLAGTEYFYMNPLASNGGYQRQPWFGCNCCPPNIHRTIASLPGYFFTTSDEGIWVHLYDACQATLRLPAGGEVALDVDTRYPWEGSVEITVQPEQGSEFALLLRIPGWAEGATASVNGTPVSEPIKPASYLALQRHWQAGDKVHLKLPMPVQLMESNPRVRENRGCVALQRGPVVYCFESVDNPDGVLADLAVDTSDELAAEWEPELLGGVVVVRGRGLITNPNEDQGPLYCPVGRRPASQRHAVKVTAIPYYAWANRGDSAMRVWVPVANEFNA